MEILDPDLWNDDGTPKKPTAEYMKNLDEAQREAVAGFGEAYLNYARIRREAKAQRSPEVADVVHFWDPDRHGCYAAMVMETESFGDGANLRVHVPGKAFEDWQCAHDEDKEFTGTWHWPCGEGR